MYARLTKTIPALALAALVGMGCQTPAPTPTALPSPTPEPTLAPSATPANAEEQLRQDVGGIMERFMKDKAMSACSVAVVSMNEQGELVKQVENFGTLSKEDDTPADENTVYEIGSLTKLITADVLAIQTMSGQMDLSYPAQDYMPEGIILPTYGTDVITLGQLALHSSGLPRRTQQIGGTRKVDGVMQQGYASDEGLIEVLSKTRIGDTPGITWQYSHLGYALLGMAEETALTKTFEELELDQVSYPLDMPHTRVVVTDEDKPHVAQGYLASGLVAPPFTTEGRFLPAAGLRSTIADMANYLAANVAPEKTTFEPALGLTHQPLGNGPDPAVSQGLGWQIYNVTRPDEVFFKAGITSGFSAYIAFSKVNKSGFVVMCNSPEVPKVAPELNALMGQESAPIDTNETAP